MASKNKSQSGNGHPQQSSIAPVAAPATAAAPVAAPAIAAPPPEAPVVVATTPKRPGRAPKSADEKAAAFAAHKARLAAMTPRDLLLYRVGNAFETFARVSDTLGRLADPTLTAACRDIEGHFGAIVERVNGFSADFALPRGAAGRPSASGAGGMRVGSIVWFKSKYSGRFEARFGTGPHRVEDLLEQEHVVLRRADGQLQGISRQHVQLTDPALAAPVAQPAPSLVNPLVGDDGMLTASSTRQ